jgi:hypothetical protein
MTIHEFIDALEPDEIDALREILEIGESRMWDELDENDELIATLKLHAELNDYHHRQLTLALLDGYGFIECCLDCGRDNFCLTAIVEELLEALREMRDAANAAEVIVDAETKRLN